MNVGTVDKQKYHITALKGKEGFTRYVIAYLDFEDGKHVVKVTRCDVGSVDGKVIVRKEFDDPHLAFNSYRKLIDDYSAVVILDDRDASPPDDLFLDSVAYHRTNPRCCFTCAYAIKDENLFFPFKTRLGMLCGNPENLDTYNRMLEEHFRGHEISKACQTTRPRIEPFGVCKNYAPVGTLAEKLCGKPEFDFRRDPDWMLFCGMYGKRRSGDFVMEFVDVYETP